MTNPIFLQMRTVPWRGPLGGQLRIAGVFNKERLGHDFLGTMTAVCFFKDVPDIVLANDLVSSNETEYVFGIWDIYVLQLLLYIVVAT